ncbi:MAG: nickel pincer cofactor biosynthesis protein LarC [Clostridia bacterium]|nr:nickel pincer cofactor biosynthesis protein LarC [Clostridia bacterium]
MKTLYLECNMGAAGDMLMAALYELLPDREGFLRTMNSLFPGVAVKPLSAKTCGISGTHMSVAVNGEEEESHDHHHGHDHDHHDHGHEHDHPHHDHGDHHHEHEHEHHHHHATCGLIGSLIGALPVPEEVKVHARAVYDAIAAAEARAHGCEIGDVHFHEVGALDAVADVMGVCLALSLLSPDRIIVSPVHVGSGQVRCAHGLMPVPAPATAALLEGVPCYGGEIRGELCTPTGAALLTHFAHSFGPMPVMAVEKTGYGLGKKEFEAANCVRAFLGESEAGGRGEITELVCNLDDMTPEALSYASARLLELGALDVYTVPGTMKKGRPGWVLTVLCEGEHEQETAMHILRETTTNGVRVRRCGKYFLAPRVEAVDGVVTKIAEGYGITHRKPEFDAAARTARETGKPIQEVLSQ